jgi:hypothetical protein
MSETRPRFSAPIILFAFNRAEYLRRVCLSLRAQRRRSLDETRVWLVQDGAVSPRSGMRYAEDADIAASIAAFREVFPRGRVLDPGGRNHGIAENIRRGERLAFQALDAEWALFVEDDLELGPDYLEVMEEMHARLAPFPNVAYFGAYGDHRRRVEGGTISWVELEHHWGFALRRDAWRALQPWLAPFYALLEGHDYKERPHLRILQWQGTLELACDRTSQDAIKALGCATLGLARVMTDVTFARYIGEQGASFTAEKFRALGYGETEVATLDGRDFAPLGRETLAAIANHASERALAFRRDAFDAFLQSFSARHFDPERPAERQDVLDAYRLILDRVPEREAIYEQMVGKVSVRELRRRLISSAEYRRRNVGA